MASLRIFLISVLAVLTAAGCSGTEEVYTSPPEPAVSSPADSALVEGRAPLTVALQVEGAALPADVQQLRFQIEALRLKAANGSWTPYLLDAAPFTVARDRETRRRTSGHTVPPAAYDSVAFRVTNASVRFNANAGAPLDVSQDDSLAVPVQVTPSPDETTTLELTFQPDSSLMRTENCRWRFRPYFTATAE